MRLLLVALAAVLLSIPAASATARASATTKHCGFFKYGTDGKNPGPSAITATNVSCWFARAVALIGPAPGWRCANTVGLRFVCKGDATGVVTFYGE